MSAEPCSCGVRTIDSLAFSFGATMVKATSTESPQRRTLAERVSTVCADTFKEAAIHAVAMMAFTQSASTLE